MDFDITSDNASQSPDQFVNLSWVGTSDSIGNTNSVNTDLVDCLVDAQQIDEVATEGIFRRKSDFDVLGLDVVDNFNGSLGDICHVLSMGEFTKE